MPSETSESERQNQETSEDSNPLHEELTDGLLSQDVQEEEPPEQQDETVDDESQTEEVVSRQEFDQFQDNLNTKFDSLMTALQQKNTVPTPQAPQQPAPANQADLDEMSNNQLAAHINRVNYSQMMPQLQQMQQNYDRRIDAMGTRVWNIIETIANDPDDFVFVKEALDMIQRSPDMEYSDALDAVRGKRMKKDNRKLSKTVRSDAHRRGKMSRRASRNPIPASKPASEQRSYDVTKGVAMIRDIVEEGKQQLGLAQ